jgi:anthranilate phosphoribosyltransferase
MSAPTYICEIKDKTTKTYTIRPEDFGYAPCEKSELVGGTPEENAKITRDILEGKEQGPKRQAVCLNAGAALYVAGKAATLAEGVKLAEALIDEGAALRKLEEFIEETNRDEELIA